VPALRSRPAAAGQDAPPPETGLAHVATVSFLAGRAAPSGVYWICLAGGVALARAAALGGLRRGFGAAAGAILQTVAIMGPARVNGPLTQALTAPVIGALHARGARLPAQLAACLAIRLAHYTVLNAVFVFIVLGGLDAYVGSYETLTGWTGVLPQGQTAAIVLGLASSVGAAIFYTTIQVLVYLRALGEWPADGPAFGRGAAAAGPDDAAPLGAGSGRFDPRAIALAAVVATALLLTGTSWPLLLAVSAWLAVAWVAARAGREAVPLGLALGVMLAVSAFAGTLLAGLGAAEAARRALRAALLVAVATWLRAAAGSDGLRTVFRRVLYRLRRLPSAREAGRVLEGLDPGPRLLAAGRALLDALADVPRRPLPVADAVIGWVAGEARGFRAGGDVRLPARIAIRARDALLVALALAPALVFVGT
jgi:hypothetical protein